jgi:hypothetical protein
VNIDHEQIARYLELAGWEKKTPLIDGVSDTYVKEKKRIDLVIDKRLNSYNDYLRSTLHSLSILDGKKTKDLVRAIERVDFLPFRVIVGEGKPRHRIGMGESADLRNGVLGLVQASSDSALEPQFQHSKYTRKEVSQFISACEEDQTEESSYSTVFLLPKTAKGKINGDAVSKLIALGLTETKGIAAREILPSPDEYEEFGKKGVSTDFLDALVKFHDIADSSGPVCFLVGSETASKLELSVSEISVIQDFVKEIKSPTTKQAIVSGKVCSLTMAPELTIVVDCNVDSRPTRLKVALSKVQFMQVEAENHRLIASSGIPGGLVVEITGQLRSRSGSRYEMYAVDQLKIIDVPGT